MTIEIDGPGRLLMVETMEEGNPIGICETNHGRYKVLKLQTVKEEGLKT